MPIQSRREIFTAAFVISASCSRNPASFSPGIWLIDYGAALPDVLARFAPRRWTISSAAASECHGVIQGLIAGVTTLPAQDCALTQYPKPPVRCRRTPRIERSALTPSSASDAAQRIWKESPAVHRKQP